MKLSIAVCSALLVTVLSAPAQAVIEWRETRTLPVDAKTLATAVSADGQWLYMLIPGEVLVYDLGENRTVTRIPVDAAFDQITYSATENSLILSGKNAKMIRVVRLEEVHAFSYDGLAFQGPEKAPVTIAVFSDYQ